MDRILIELNIVILMLKTPNLSRPRQFIISLSLSSLVSLAFQVSSVYHWCRLLLPHWPVDLAKQNSYLTSIRMRGIKKAVFSLKWDNAPGSDNLSAYFFHACWEIVGDSVIVASRNFFESGKLHKPYDAFFLILIPKTKYPSSFSDFRFTSLNFTCSIFFQILVSRLATLLRPSLPTIKWLLLK